MTGHNQWEDELQELLDGRLEGPRRAAALAYLEENADAAEFFEDLKRQDAALQRLGARILNEPIPERLRAIVRHEQSRESVQTDGGLRWRFRFRFIEAAAASVIFICGGIAGWWVHRSINPVPSQVEALLQNASHAYAFYGSSDGFPAEFSPERSKDLEDWIGKLFGRPIPYPDLSPLGYQFAGGNILPGSAGQTLFFLFSRAEGGRVSIVAWASEDPPSQALAATELGDVAARYWFTDGLGFAVLGNHTDSGLGEISESVFKFYQGDEKHG